VRHKKRNRLSAQTIAASVIVILVISILMVLLFSRVFVVRDIMIVGNRNLLKEEVITQSGVKMGDNLLKITSAGLKERLERNRYIEYEGHGFDYRGMLTIRITERLGMAVSNVLGLYYVMDEAGVVLECAGSAYPVDVAGPRVTGLIIDQNTRVVVGEKMPVHDRVQLEEMELVLDTLDSIGLLARISLLDVKNTGNMYLMTSDGAKIELGDGKNMKTKLLIAREVLSIREDMEDLKGVKIDVSNGRNAHYIPAVLPTMTPVPTATPTLAPPMTPKP